MNHVSHMYIIPHLPPPPRHDIQDPHVIESVIIVILSSSD